MKSINIDISRFLLLRLIFYQLLITAISALSSEDLGFYSEPFFKHKVYRYVFCIVTWKTLPRSSILYRLTLRRPWASKSLFKVGSAPPVARWETSVCRRVGISRLKEENMSVNGFFHYLPMILLIISFSFNFIMYSYESFQFAFFVKFGHIIMIIGNFRILLPLFSQPLIEFVTSGSLRIVIRVEFYSLPAARTLIGMMNKNTFLLNYLP